MNFWTYAVIFDLVILYWIASLCFALLRRNPTFHKLTRYGARQFRDEASLADDDSLPPDGLPADAALRFSGGEKTSKARVSLVTRLRNSLLRITHKGLRWVEHSPVGRVRVSRQWAFASFYLCGLLTCVFLWKQFPSTPCADSAEAAVRTIFEEERLRFESASPSVRRIGSRGVVDAQMREVRFQREWAEVLKTKHWLVDTPFQDLRNITLIEQAHEVFVQQYSVCEEYVSPLRLWENLPLILFGIHCFLRLMETVGVQCFRGGKEDQVTLFALLAGCSFYIAAAISSDFGAFASLRREEAIRSFQEWDLLPVVNGAPLLISGARGGRGGGASSSFSSSSPSSPLPYATRLFSEVLDEAMSKVKVSADRFQTDEHFGGALGLWCALVQLGPWFVPRTILVLFTVIHLGLQWTQVHHHEILSSMRRGPQAKERLQDRLQLAKHVQDVFKKTPNLGDKVASRRDASDHKLIHSSGVTYRGHQEGEEDVSEEEMEEKEEDMVHTANVYNTRMASESTISNQVPENEAAHAAHARLHDAVYDESVWQYRFPFRGLFKLVLEPHYLCEVLLYLVQLVIISILLFYSIFPPAARRKHLRLLPWLIMFAPGHAVPSISLVTVILAQWGAALGVLFFSALNLCLTAEEHREFWNQLNEKRVLVKEFVLEHILLPEDVEESPESAAFWADPNAGQHYPHSRAMKESKLLEERVLRRRMHRRLFTATDPEMLPGCNMVPLVW